MDTPSSNTTGAASDHVVGKTYKPTRFMRHPLTKKNQRELNILTGEPPPF